MRVAGTLGARELGEFVALAVGHELYHHRERIGEVRVLAGRDERESAAGAFARELMLERRDVTLVAGIDGGQSSTVAAIGDERGRVLGRGAAGPADEIGAGPESTRLFDALRDALDDARRNAGLPDRARFDAIVAGVSGYDGRVYGRTLALPSAARAADARHADRARRGAGRTAGRRGDRRHRLGGLRARGERLVDDARRLGLSLRRRGKRVSHRDATRLRC